MKSKFLFPAWCGIVGYLMTIPGFILGYCYTFKNYKIPGFGFQMREQNRLFEPVFENFTNELAIFLVVIGLVLIAFSKSKREDELSAKLRLNALYWGIMVYYVCYILVLLLSITVGEIPFIGDHASEINIFTPLLIFIFRYYYLKYFNKESYLMSEPKFLPNRPFKRIAVFGALSSALIFTVFLFLVKSELSDTLIKGVYSLMILCSLVWVYVKNRVEDEMTMQLRLESLQLAVYFNYGVLLLATIFFYSFSYLVVLLFAQFSLLLFFIIRMEYVNYKNNKQLNALEEGMGYEK
ncbi:hypothetical protein FA048_03475 [Pedobacter polaris]|uniref:Uncharacterized protein n=1 Tax=Pedobacter polaris TaxID=2571273 RepID=A0A4V5P086_9SPHI|nr:hypothetical protein [Pedobacter polaris]TKC12692.1 hypothetical protein FA048_03475 [Pedobacter polaris]